MSVGCTGYMGVQGGHGKAHSSTVWLCHPRGDTEDTGTVRSWRVTHRLYRWMGHVKPITLLDTLVENDSMRWSHTPGRHLATPQHPNSS